MSKRTRRPQTAKPKGGSTALSAQLVEPENVEPAPSPAAPLERTWQHRLTEVDAEPVSESALRRLMADWRRGRATRHLWDLVQDGYVALLAVAIVGAMLVSVLVRAQGVISECSSVGCQSGRSLLPWATLFGVMAVTLMVSRLFGPVVASAAEGFWLMDAPIRRGRLLSGRLIGVVLASGVVAAALGALVATLTGLPGAAIGAWAVASGLAASGLVSFAAAEQTADRTWVVKALQWVAGAAGIAALLGVVSVAAGWLTLPWLTASSQDAVQLAYAVGAGAAVLLVGALVVALLRLDRIRRTRLTSGGSLVSGMQGAMFAMDLGLMRDILVERDAADRGHVRPTRGRGLGTSALVWRDVQRLVRFPKQLVLLLLSLVVPYAVGALGLAGLMPFISALVLLAGMIPLLGSLRVLTRTGGLARSFPFTTAQLRTAAITVPAVLAAVWAVAAVPAFLGLGSGTQHLSPVTAIGHALVTAVAGFVGAVRWVSAKPPNYSAPLVQTGVGAMPPGMMGNLIKGFDMVAIIVGPLLLGAPVWVSLVIAAIAFFFLRAPINTEEMRAMQEEQQRQLAEARNPQKKTIERPKR